LYSVSLAVYAFSCPTLFRSVRREHILERCREVSECLVRAFRVLLVRNPTREQLDVEFPLHALEGHVLCNDLAPEWIVIVRESPRSEEHTSELQSRENLVCRL